jgi:membrane protein implicated in regulation of membrane protease activity
MDMISTLYFTHPFWVWLAIGALFLGVEVVTGSGYLLWPAGAAAVMAVVNLAGLRIGLPAELALFALLTLVSTITAKRYLPKGIHSGPDINDPMLRLVGRRGVATASFLDGRGRVSVDGKDWAAELEEDFTVEAGSPVVIDGVVDGARLRVRPA